MFSHLSVLKRIVIASLLLLVMNGALPAQQTAKNLTIEDGWVYFVHGWLCVIAEVFDLDIPASGSEFDELCRIAAAAR